MDISAPQPKPTFSGPTPPSIPNVPKTTPPAVPKPPLPMPPKPLPPKPLAAPPKPTAPPASTPSKPKINETVSIHTMKDDLLASRMPTSPARPAMSTSQASPVPYSTPVSSAPIPLAPTSATIPGKSVVLPAQKSSTGSMKGLITGIIIVLVIILIGGVGAWYFFLKGPATKNEVAIEQKPISNTIPANLVAITEYAINDTTRVSISKLWAQQTASQPTFDSLLAGDPRLVLQNPDVKVLYYIQLPQEPRPFLVTPDVPSIATLFENTASAQTVTQSGWRIAHPVHVATYVQAIAQGEASSEIQSFLAGNTTSAGMRTYLSSDITNTILQSQIGAAGQALTTHPLSLKSDIANPSVLSFTGTAKHPNDGTTIVAANPQVLDFVPANAQFVYAGHALGADITRWSSQPSMFAGDIVRQPAVNQLITELNGSSYAFFQQKGGTNASGGNPGFGVIVQLPAALEKNLLLDKTTLETALFSITPLITGKSGALPTLPIFADGAYEGLPLRYVNINGPTAAIDYTISNGYLLIGTSKDTMFEMLGTLTKKTGSLLSQNVQLQPARDLLSTHPTQRIIVLKGAETAFLKYVLPGFSGSLNTFIVSLFTSLDTETETVSGILAL